MAESRWKFEPQGGKPKTVCTVMNFGTTATTIGEDHHQSVRALATELKIIWKFIPRILMGESGMKKMYLAQTLHILRMEVSTRTGLGWLQTIAVSHNGESQCG